MSEDKKSREEEIRFLKSKLQAAHEEIARLTSLEEKSIYPNLRIGFDGTLLFANTVSHLILSEWDVHVNTRIPERALNLIQSADSLQGASAYVKIPFRHFSVGFLVVPVKELGYYNLFGNEVDYIHTAAGEDVAKQYRLLLENSQAVLIRWICEDRCPVEFVSDNISQFGYSSQEFITRQILYTDIIHPQDSPRVMKELAKHQEKQNLQYHQEYRILTKNGDIRWIDDRTKVDKDNKLYHEAVLIDITDRKKAELMLQSSMEELKKVNSELDRFVYSASHDLKAPLRSIMGLINLAKSEAASPGQDVYMDKIHKSATKLDSFINDLISFSRNARLDAQIKQINFEALISETVENLKYMEHADRLIIYSEVNDVPFFSDENRLSILFSNMISNAIKYQDLASSKPAELHVLVRLSKTHANIEFRDNGLGIEKENLSKIFKMFFRASVQSEGSGLGLFIVKEIVNKLGGKIRVTSTPGSGTSFFLSIPNKIDS